MGALKEPEAENEKRSPRSQRNPRRKRRRGDE